MPLPQADLTPKLGPLLSELRTLVVAHRAAFGQARILDRAWLLLLGWLFAFSRKTMTQLLIALGLLHQDWSAWYRVLSQPRLDYAELSAQFLLQTLVHVPADQPYRVVVDATSV